jgi:hypothetical protein
VLDRYAANGGKVKVGESIIKTVPRLATDAMRGWPPGMTWEHADGVYDTYSGTAVSCEYFKDYGDNLTAKSRRAAGTMLHELGHGLDERLEPNRPLSLAREFQDAYYKDAAAVKAAGLESRYSYYLQSGSAGSSEAFAETFAQVHGHGAMYWDKDFLANWPNVRKVIESKLAGVT